MQPSGRFSCTASAFCPAQILFSCFRGVCVPMYNPRGWPVLFDSWGCVILTPLNSTSVPSLCISSLMMLILMTSMMLISDNHTMCAHPPPPIECCSQITNTPLLFNLVIFCTLYNRYPRPGQSLKECRPVCCLCSCLIPCAGLSWQLHASVYCSITINIVCKAQGRNVGVLVMLLCRT